MPSKRLILAGLCVGLLAGCGSSNAPNSTPTSSVKPTMPATSVMASPTPTPTASASAAPSGSASPTAHAGPPPCTNNIRVINGESQGAAGHLTLVLIFNNVGHTSCTIYGYPGLDLVTASGATVAHARRTLNGMAGGATTIAPVVLAAGASASALVEASDVPQGSITNCGSYSLKVTPPGEYVAVPAGTAMMPKCDLQIHPVVAGTGGGMR